MHRASKRKVRNGRNIESNEKYGKTHRTIQAQARIAKSKQLLIINLRIGYRGSSDHKQSGQYHRKIRIECRTLISQKRGVLCTLSIAGITCWKINIDYYEKFSF